MKKAALIYLFVLLVFSQPGYGQTSQQAESMKDFVSEMQFFPGHFNFYYDANTDKIYLEIAQFEEEFLYVNSLSAGVGSNDIGLDRGQLGNERVVKFERHGPKVFLVQPNYTYRAITNNGEEEKAVQEAFAQSILWGFTIEAEENGKVLLDATEFFLQDAHNVIGRLSDTEQGSFSLDKSRSAIFLERTKNFPKNTEFEVSLTFVGKATGSYINSVTPSSGIVSVRQHHSFIQLPDDAYKPRKFDPRAGYFAHDYYDYAVPLGEPMAQKHIYRHRLEKKNPTQEISEAIEPIVYYLDRGTPEPILSALMEGALWWNQAFEELGYKNAFQVKLMPEGADPMDVRYNVIQWVHRSTRGWSYGSSINDPRTGEILKGHVSLGSLRVRHDYLLAEGLLAPYSEGAEVNDAMQQMALARLRQLSAHEVGHTLGLAHSYTSSTEGNASVMDYPQPFVEIIEGELSLKNAYDTAIGVWDKHSIAYGYKEFANAEEEEAGLESLIQEGFSKNLSFISDADARPTGGAHPTAHLWDNGSDVVAELDRMMQVRSIALSNFGENNIQKDMPLALLEETFVPIYFYHRYQVEAVSKLIGGLQYTYAMRGDGQVPTELINPELQYKALGSLLHTISPEALSVPLTLIESIPPYPMGYYKGREVIKANSGITFNPFGYAEASSAMTFRLLLNPDRVNRLVNQHSLYPSQPSLESIFEKVVAKTILADKQKDYKGHLQMINNTVFIYTIFHLLSDERLTAQSKAIVSAQLDHLESLLKEQLKNTNKESWKTHYTWELKQIEQYKTNPREYKFKEPVAAPPGSPIGHSCSFMH